jgi:hypothetical protein
MLDTESVQQKAKHVSDFCLCGKCSLMDTEAENICCKASRFCVKMPTDSCVTEHCDFNTIINKGSFSELHVCHRQFLDMKYTAPGSANARPPLSFPSTIAKNCCKFLYNFFFNVSGDLQHIFSTTKKYQKN